MLSGLEVRRWVINKELEGVRIGKISRRGNIFVFELFGAKKKFLIVRPGAIYLADYAPRGNADSFCMYLRKRISGKKVKKVEQVGSDRIVKLVFEGYEIIFEIFGKGNVIVVKDGIIENALLQRSWRGREIKKGLKYVPPPSFDWLSMGEEAYKLIEGKSKAEVAKILGLGKKIEKYWSDNARELIRKLLEEAKKPLSSDEIAEVMIEKDKEELVEEERRKREEKIKRLEKSIEELKEKIKEYEEKAKRYRKAADYIFQNLQEINKAIEEARKSGEKKIKVSLPIDKRGAS